MKKMIFLKKIAIAFLLAAIPLLWSCDKTGGNSADNSEADSTMTEEPVQEPAGLTEEEVEYTSDTLKMKGFLVYDASIQGPRPGVLVVHEWWGHNDYARERARQLAKMGYTALAVDMFGNGKQAGHPDDAGAFAGEVFANMDGMQARFNAAKTLLEAHPSSDPAKTAAIGYCFGGGVVLHMARFGSDLKGVASFHGSLGTKSPAKAGAVKAEVLVCHGNADKFVPAEQVSAFKKEMAAAGVKMEFHGYDSALHSFTNPGADAFAEKFQMPVGYNEAADKDSWASLEAFLKRVFAEASAE